MFPTYASVAAKVAPIAAAHRLSNLALFRDAQGRTEEANGAAGAGEDTQGAVGVVLQCVLDAGHDGAYGGALEGGLARVFERALGLEAIAGRACYGGWWTGTKLESAPADWTAPGCRPERGPARRKFNLSSTTHHPRKVHGLWSGFCLCMAQRPKVCAPV